MHIVRPITESDLDALYELAGFAKAGLTTLPQDRKILENRIKNSCMSFQKCADKAGGELYFFVLEDLEQKKIVGTCSIVSKVGGFEPFYTYQIKTTHIKSKRLGIDKDIQYLQLVRNHSGPTEIGTLFLLPEHRKGGLGRFLALSRFLFLAQYRNCFEEQVIAELRGHIDTKGHSPFWDALGQHFFEVELKKADLMMMSDKSFIAELIPEHPIYIPLLTKKAQAVIGEVHADTRPAKYLLESEGFKFIHEIDIFEAGPVMGCAAGDIQTVKNSQEGVVERIVDEEIDSSTYLVANVKVFEDFRASLGRVRQLKNGRVEVPKSLASALGLKKGYPARFALLKPVKGAA
jgi:arginine N-succinyltransferase